MKFFSSTNHTCRNLRPSDGRRRAMPLSVAASEVAAARLLHVRAVLAPHRVRLGSLRLPRTRCRCNRSQNLTCDCARTETRIRLPDSRRKTAGFGRSYMSLAWQVPRSPGSMSTSSSSFSARSSLMRGTRNAGTRTLRRRCCCEPMTRVPGQGCARAPLRAAAAKRPSHEWCERSAAV